MWDSKPLRGREAVAYVLVLFAILGVAVWL